MTTSIEIFKSGKHTDVSGKTLPFTDDDLIACAQAYDPAVFKAPLVVGHPKLDDPAYGWVGSLKFKDAKLKANPEQVDPAFAELVNDGKFPKVSASFYLPDSPDNPKPGVLYLKHIGFLGAAAPAIKGLKTVSFAADEQGVVEFADWDQMTIAGLFRSIREWIIGKNGLEEADKVLPSYQIESLQINAAQERDENPPPYFSENDQMTPEQQAEFDKLKSDNALLSAENTTLKSQVASFSEAAEASNKAALHTANVSFAEGLVKEGKLLPAGKDGVVALLDQLAAQDGKVEFGEGDGKTSETALDIYKKQLSAAPKLVDFGEHTPGGNEADVVNFAAPDGLSVDSARLELHNKATAYAAEHGVSYTEALAKVK